jgi:mannose-6-phosphate isomerase-like protein (cupin superfamily)
MRHVPMALLLLGLIGETAAAQQFVAAPPASKVTARMRASARREAERERRRVDVVYGSMVQEEAAGWLRGSRTLGKTVLTSGDEQTTYLLVHRTEPSKPEVHARWDDLVLIRAGTGAIILGDSLVGSTYRAPGERIGGSFVGRYQIVVHPGDIVRIPAAVPHAFVVSSTEALEYLVIKQRQQRLPIRWFEDTP